MGPLNIVPRIHFYRSQSSRLTIRISDMYERTASCRDFQGSHNGSNILKRCTQFSTGSEDFRSVSMKEDAIEFGYGAIEVW